MGEDPRFQYLQEGNDRVRSHSFQLKTPIEGKLSFAKFYQLMETTRTRQDNQAKTPDFDIDENIHPNYKEGVQSLYNNSGDMFQGVEYKSFEEADLEWTQLVTGVNCTCRRWIDWKSELELPIFPAADFEERYMNVVNGYVDMNSQASRFHLLTVYFRDIILRPEFMNFLRVFPSFELSAESKDAKKRVLHGKTDFGIGYHGGCDV